MHIRLRLGLDHAELLQDYLLLQLGVLLVDERIGDYVRHALHGHLGGVLQDYAVETGHLLGSEGVELPSGTLHLLRHLEGVHVPRLPEHGMLEKMGEAVDAVVLIPRTGPHGDEETCAGTCRYVLREHRYPARGLR